MELITSVTVGSGGAASVTLPATGTIPATYTDLKVVISSRNTDIYNEIHFRFNGDTGNNYSGRNIYGNGSSATSSSSSSISSLQNLTVESVSGQTASTFGNTELYIPNYTSSNYKSISADGVQENNATSAQAMLGAGLWANTAAITTITAFPSIGTFAEGSTFYLYGISNVTSTTKATGGIVSSDGTYNYHMFPFSGTFTPTEAISADVMVIAGGGGADGPNYSGGGGAGGFRVLTSQSLTTTAYTCTVGAGGAAGAGYQGIDGGSSSFAGSGFATISSSGGGGGGSDSGINIGRAGGSGGGSYTNSNVTGGAGNTGGYSPVEGYAGGKGGTGIGGGGGGGGGASQIGGTNFYTYGGDGSSAYSSWGLATQTGEMVGGTAWYAGGGGGGAGAGGSPVSQSSPTFGGKGGGGQGGSYLVSGQNRSGLSNTGGGGGGVGGTGGSGAAGGSGLIIIRYAI